MTTVGAQVGLIGGLAGKAAGAIGRKVVPEHASGFVRSVVERAIDGAGPLPSAARSATAALAEADGVVERAIGDLIESHVKLAGAQGFLTNIGGLLTAVVGIPANITGLAFIQCHLVAGIAYLRGYDLQSRAVRNAILACLLGKSVINDLVGKNQLPATPLGLATAALTDQQVDDQISQTITAELLAGVGGKRVATLLGKRIPLLGGAIGGAADGYGTWQVGRYAARELVPPPIAPA